ncbi:hypothetical protein GUITHDRAFT_151159, partial [Guillardia theta CCMP2712]
MTIPSRNQKLVNVCDLYGCHTVLVSSQQQQALRAEHEERLRARKEAYAMMINRAHQNSQTSAHLEQMAMKEPSVKSQVQHQQHTPEIKHADASPPKSFVRSVDHPAPVQPHSVHPPVEIAQHQMEASSPHGVSASHLVKESLSKTSAAPHAASAVAGIQSKSALSHMSPRTASQVKKALDGTQPPKSTVTEAPQHPLLARVVHPAVAEVKELPPQPAVKKILRPQASAGAESMHVVNEAEQEKKAKSKRALIRKALNSQGTLKSFGLFSDDRLSAKKSEGQMPFFEQEFSDSGSKKVTKLAQPQLAQKVSRPAHENLGSIIDSGFADKTFKKGSVQSEQPLFDRFVGMKAPLIADSHAVKLAAARRLSEKHASLEHAGKPSRGESALRSLDTDIGFHDRKVRAQDSNVPLFSFF